MNLKKIFQYGFIVSCFLSNAIATDDAHDDELDRGKKTFKCPTIDEIHARAKELKESTCWGPYTSQFFTLRTEEGVFFKAQIDSNKNMVQRASNLKEYDYTCWIERSDGSLKKILFRYSPGQAQDLILKVDFKKMGINPINVSYPTGVSSTYVSLSLDGTKYIRFNNPDFIFTIHQ